MYEGIFEDFEEVKRIVRGLQGDKPIDDTFVFELLEDLQVVDLVVQVLTENLRPTGSAALPRRDDDSSRDWDSQSQPITAALPRWDDDSSRDSDSQSPVLILDNIIPTNNEVEVQEQEKQATEDDSIDLTHASPETLDQNVEQEIIIEPQLVDLTLKCQVEQRADPRNVQIMDLTLSNESDVESDGYYNEHSWDVPLDHEQSPPLSSPGNPLVCTSSPNPYNQMADYLNQEEMESRIEEILEENNNDPNNNMDNIQIVEQIRGLPPMPDIAPSVSEAPMPKLDSRNAESPCSPKPGCSKDSYYAESLKSPSSSKDLQRQDAAQHFDEPNISDITTVNKKDAQTIQVEQNQPKPLDWKIKKDVPFIKELQSKFTDRTQQLVIEAGQITQLLPQLSYDSISNALQSNYMYANRVERALWALLPDEEPLPIWLVKRKQEDDSGCEATAAKRACSTLIEQTITDSETVANCTDSGHGTITSLSNISSSKEEATPDKTSEISDDGMLKQNSGVKVIDFNRSTLEPSSKADTVLATMSDYREPKTPSILDSSSDSPMVQNADRETKYYTWPSQTSNSPSKSTKNHGIIKPAKLTFPSCATVVPLDKSPRKCLLSPAKFTLDISASFELKPSESKLHKRVQIASSRLDSIMSQNLVPSDNAKPGPSTSEDSAYINVPIGDLVDIYVPNVSPFRDKSYQKNGSNKSDTFNVSKFAPESKMMVDESVSGVVTKSSSNSKPMGNSVTSRAPTLHGKTGTAAYPVSMELDTGIPSRSVKPIVGQYNNKILSQAEIPKPKVVRDNKYMEATSTSGAFAAYRTSVLPGETSSKKMLPAVPNKTCALDFPKASSSSLPTDVAGPSQNKIPNDSKIHQKVITAEDIYNLHIPEYKPSKAADKNPLPTARSLILAEIEELKPARSLVLAEIEELKEQLKQSRKEQLKPTVLNAPKETPPKELYNPLRNMFPDVDPDYVAGLCIKAKETKTTLEMLVDVLLESADRHIRVIVPQPEPTQCNVDDQYENLLGIFPDACPMFLRDFAEKNFDKPDNIKDFVQTRLESHQYPTKADYLKRTKITEQQLQYTTEFDVERFLEIFPDPIAYFENPNRKHVYQPIAFEFLKSHFNRNRINTISSQYSRSGYHISLTAKQLGELGSDMKSKRYASEMPTDQIPLLQEFAFIRNKALINMILKNRKEQEKQEFQELKEKGALLECQCCYDGDCVPSKCSTCTEGHIFCNSCIVTGTETKIGEGKTQFPCFVECSGEFLLPVLQKVLKPTIFSILLQKRQEAEVKAAGLEGLVDCPFCHFASIPPPQDKVFKCLNPECMKETCRLCKELNHVPLRCDEVVKVEEARRYLEETMTKALVRKCYKCSAPFFKEEGCNKMTCNCGAMMCYICGKPVKDYSHFNGQGSTRTDLCPLWSDNRLLNAETVRQVAQSAHQEILNKNPNLNLDTQKLMPSLPQATKGPHQDIANGNMLPVHAQRGRDRIPPQ